MVVGVLLAAAVAGMISGSVIVVLGLVDGVFVCIVVD